MTPPPDVTPLVLQGDLDDERLAAYTAAGEIAVDTETMGLNLLRDRLCVVQICDRAERATIVQIPRADGPAARRAPRLKALLESTAVVKVFHFARFDVAALRQHLGIEVAPLYCTLTASRFARTYSDRHSLRDVALDLLGVELDKWARHTDWSNPSLTPEQLRYATNDVTLLLKLKDKLDALLLREERRGAAQDCFGVIPVLARLDLMGYPDLFADW
jgi:ribonuclease D